MFYVKNCKKEQFCFILLMFFAFLTRGTLFRAGRPIATKTHTYYLAHENPYQRSCWGKREQKIALTQDFKVKKFCKKNTFFIG